MKRTGAAPAGHTALLQAAREEFAERGYDGTSIRQIAQRAGMSLSVLYHYYPGKTELLQAIVDEAMDAYFGACEAALVRPRRSRREGTARRAWRHCAWRFARRLRQAHC